MQGFTGGLLCGCFGPPRPPPGRYLSACVRRRQPHLPEIRLQPRRLAEQRSQFDEALLGHRTRGEIVEMAPRRLGDRLVALARIFADPLAIGMRTERISTVRRQLAADLRVTDDA